ncbi:MAG: hypothetical protein HYR60_21265 [Acidobacteria bacterium]|nr:hypothetical protein [Acidobacteriota bacterium]MBI3473836.1 hypothetical protein [Candidatus Solibacter usitatus]
MKRVLLAAALAAALLAQRPRVKPASLTAMEKSADQHVMRLLEDPFLLLGPARGLYLEGYGAVFSAEINLVAGPTLNPFRQAISKEEVVRVHTRKLQRLPGLRQTMRETLLAAAASLDEVPAEEKIAFEVKLLAQSYEDLSGLPSRIQMQGQRAKLVEAKLGRVAAESVIKVLEF